MTTPGVGPVVALTYRATVDVPAADQEQRIEVVPACSIRPSAAKDDRQA